MKRLVSSTTRFGFLIVSSIINAASVTPTPASPFGAAWAFLYGYSGVPAANYATQLKEIGAGFTKVYLFWNQLEPSKGRFDWTALDAFANQLPTPDAGLVAIFSASQWGSEKPSAMLPPSAAKNPDDYYRFVFETVKHANGRVRFWQNDCEPNNPVFWSGTKEQFVAQSKVFYQAVKAADPNAVVIIGGYDGLFVPPALSEVNGQKPRPFPQQQGGLEFFDYVMREAKDSFDVFDLRLYGDPYTINARIDYIRGKMKAYGYERPMICTEYGGPNLFEFPENRKYLPLIATWSQAVTTTDEEGGPTSDHAINQIEKLYREMGTLAPQTQMFMQDCPPELEAKFERIQSRSLVMRNLFGLSGDMKAMIYWDLINLPGRRDDLMKLMYGKIGLYKVEGAAIGACTLTGKVFARMTHTLNGARHVERIIVADQPSVYLFKVDLTHGRSIYVAWEYREPFIGEDQPAVAHHWPSDAKDAEATDIFGKSVPVTVLPGRIELLLSLDPVFIALKN
jgi:hypothetical protein